MFILDLLDNLPRLRLSDDHLKVVIWALKECGATDVPSFHSLRTKQAQLTKEVNIKTTHHTSAQENHFYATCPSETSRLDFANPLVRPHMKFLPRVGTSVSEFRDGEKWLNMNEDALERGQLMWMDEKKPHRHFYIKELARLRDGRYVMPLRFVEDNEVDCLDGFLVVHYPATGIFVVRSEELIRVAAEELQDNVVELQNQLNIQFDALAPLWVRDVRHPVRAKAANRPTFTVRLMAWCDDVSGNKTKQYNAHTNVYVANINLPHEKLKQEYFVRFCSTSQHASSAEQLEGLAKDTGPDKWHAAYDCKLQQEVLFRIIPHVFPADNPQQSEHCSHIGGNGNKPCRSCKIGGTAEERETDEIYESFFSSGPHRTTEWTISQIESQLWIAGLGVQNTVDLMQTNTGVKDKTAQYWINILIKKARALQHERITAAATRDPRLNDRTYSRDAEAKQAVKTTINREIQQELHDWLVQQPSHSYDTLPADSPLRDRLRPGDHYNVLLGLPGVEIHFDTPGEILHTYLLGQEKYVWHKTTSPWDKKKDELFAARLRGSSVDGLTLPPLRAEYLLQYKNSLVGKHFKALQQVGVFHLHDDLCSDIIRELWKATGELGAMLWYNKIRKMDEYLADLEILIANVLDIWVLIDPNRILTKNKLHVLAHLIANIPRFGPAILYSTEVFECWNAIFRFCSILSNHRAPSRDIAVVLADMERFKHQVSGGWWRNSAGEYVQAGERVCTFLQENPSLQRRLGWVENLSAMLVVGSVKLEAQLKRHPASWAQSIAPLSLPPPTDNVASNSDSLHTATIFQECKSLVSQSKDICKPGSWVFFKTSRDVTPVIPDVGAGRVFKILSPVGGGEAVAVIQHFDIMGKRDGYLNMPILTPSNRPHQLAPCSHNLFLKDVLFIFNAQHDCYACHCTTAGLEHVIQERVVTARTRLHVTHAETPRYLLNMHALHNADLIRETLPRNLTEPQYYLADRQVQHCRIATALRVTGSVRRKQIAAKAAETRARNKEARATTAPSRNAQLRDENSGNDPPNAGSLSKFHMYMFERPDQIVEPGMANEDVGTGADDDVEMEDLS
ncbi:uncharacterized protein B0H18DRAFT_942872 [Fomitopsis serialis]|uniref:uncharacterized protein n=1 Tax=Fomitopsis serialis TaxID=139415 RepID=UPI002008DFB4|nr:uncharacterized protein B0H18DRAFT_942872 [Neoantrodia serialis]KAH9912209.1 hypothetical protein B0H18DRAFT_942872 [Neoantrodia serialis]